MAIVLRPTFIFAPFEPTRAAILIFLTNWFYRIFTRFGTWRSFWDPLLFSHHTNPPGRHFDFFDELILSHIYAFRNVAIVLRPTFIFAPYWTHPAAILIFLTNWFYRIFTRFGTWRSFWDPLLFSHHTNPPGRHFDFFDELILSHIYAFRNVAIVLRPTFIFAPYEPTRPPFWIFWRTDFIAYLRVSERGDRSETNFYFRTILTHPAAILIFLTNWFNRIFMRFGTWRSFWDHLQPWTQPIAINRLPIQSVWTYHIRYLAAATKTFTSCTCLTRHS